MPKQLTQGARLRLREIEASDSELKKKLWAWPEEKRLAWILGFVLIKRPHQLRSLARDETLLADLEKNPPPKSFRNNPSGLKPSG